jgi:hypothetical protein
MSKAINGEIQRELAKMKISQSPNVIITTLGMETVVAPTRIKKCA